MSHDDLASILSAMPPDVPEWFEPSGMPPKPVVPDRHAVASDALRDELARVLLDDEEPQSEAAKAWMAGYREAVRRQQQWYRLLSVARAVQWRLVFARCMLSQREALDAKAIADVLGMGL